MLSGCGGVGRVDLVSVQVHWGVGENDSVAIASAWNAGLDPLSAAVVRYLL